MRRSSPNVNMLIALVFLVGFALTATAIPTHHAGTCSPDFDGVKTSLVTGGKKWSPLALVALAEMTTEDHEEEEKNERRGKDVVDYVLSSEEGSFGKTYGIQCAPFPSLLNLYTSVSLGRFG
jgi:hypothetical protein